MKKSSQIIILLTLLVIPFGCEKMPFDYRNIYIGDYDFTVIKTTWSFFPQTSSIVDTLKYIGKVSYGKDSESILIRYLPSDEVETKIDRKGKFGMEGNFNKDTLNFFRGSYRWDHINVIGIKHN